MPPNWNRAPVHSFKFINTMFRDFSSSQMVQDFSTSSKSIHSGTIGHHHLALLIVDMLASPEGQAAQEMPKVR